MAMEVDDETHKKALIQREQLLDRWREEEVVINMVSRSKEQGMREDNNSNFGRRGVSMKGRKSGRERRFEGFYLENYSGWQASALTKLDATSKTIMLPLSFNITKKMGYMDNRVGRLF